jgi:hypothetical protein
LSLRRTHRPAADPPRMKIEHPLAVIARSRFATRQSAAAHALDRIAASQVLLTRKQVRAHSIPCRRAPSLRGTALRRGKLIHSTCGYRLPRREAAPRNDRQATLNFRSGRVGRRQVCNSQCKQCVASQRASALMGHRAARSANTAANQNTCRGPAAGHRRDTYSGPGAQQATGHRTRSRAASATVQTQHRARQQDE